MSGQETGGQELRERIAERVALWLVAYPISSWNLCGGDPDRERTLGKTWGDGIADDLLPLVQPQLDAKDARIAGFEAEAKRAELADALALEHAQAADRDIKALIARAEAAEAKLAEAGYGTHRCVRCGKQQAKEGEHTPPICPPCCLLIVGDVVNAQATEIKQLMVQTLAQAAERDRLRAAEQRVRELRDKWLQWPEDDPHYAAGLMLSRYLDQGDGQETT